MGEMLWYKNNNNNDQIQVHRVSTVSNSKYLLREECYPQGVIIEKPAKLIQSFYTSNSDVGMVFKNFQCLGIWHLENQPQPGRRCEFGNQHLFEVFQIHFVRQNEDLTASRKLVGAINRKVELFLCYNFKCLIAAINFESSRYAGLNGGKSTHVLYLEISCEKVKWYKFWFSFHFRPSSLTDSEWLSQFLLMAAFSRGSLPFWKKWGVAWG